MMWCEEDVIAAIRGSFGNDGGRIRLGMGDDCAQLGDGLTLITTDASIEGVHFDLDWMTPGDAAYRCLTSNLSDVAAMGARAAAFTLALGLRPDLPFDAVRNIIDGLKQCLLDHDMTHCILVGGDVVRSPVVMFSVTMLGETPPWPIVTRHGASPGDIIGVLGHIGYAALGLELCKNGCCRDNHPTSEIFLNAFKRPRCLPHLGPQLAQAQCLTSMMDTSDGIMTDLPRLLTASSCGATVELDHFCPDAEMIRTANRCHADARNLMVCGGEDFGLLFTCRENKLKLIRHAAACSNIPLILFGQCTKTAPGHILWTERGKQTHPINRSFSHF